MRFEWDPGKNRRNWRKHGVSFEQASELFTSGTDFFEIYDEHHSAKEEWFLAVGPIAAGVVVVVYVEVDEDTVRIISARMATPRERRLYREHMEAT